MAIRTQDPAADALREWTDVFMRHSTRDIQSVARETGLSLSQVHSLFRLHFRSAFPRTPPGRDPGLTKASPRAPGPPAAAPPAPRPPPSRGNAPRSLIRRGFLGREETSHEAKVQGLAYDKDDTPTRRGRLAHQC